MPLSQQTQQAIVAAFGNIARGVPLTTGDTSFWRQFGLPPWRQRQLIISRAEALHQGSRNVEGLTGGDVLSDIWTGTGYERCGGRCGPAETEQATVRVKAWFQEADGKWTMRTYVKMKDWDTSIDSIRRSITSWIVAMQRGYGLSNGEADLSTMMVY